MDKREWVDRLFREYAKELFRYLLSFRLSEEDTYDLVQDAYVKLLDVKPWQVRQPKVWLFAVGRNLAINQLKWRGRWAGNPDVEGIVDESPGMLPSILEDEDRALLWKAFSRLPGRDQEMLGLYLEHEFSYRQIAALLGKSEISVRVAMHRSRNQLKKLLRSEDGQNKRGSEKGD
jgi:RNA polymerase sigma factor (sigma-70 family)